MALQIQPTDIQYGDVYWIQVMNYGSGKPRPWLIVSPTESNRGDLVEAIPSSTVLPHIHQERYVQIQLPKSTKLSYFKCAHRIKIDRSQLGEFITQLTQQEMNLVHDTIEISNGPATREDPPITKSKSKPSIHSVPTWSHITSLPIEQQLYQLQYYRSKFTAKELAARWDISTSNIYLKIKNLTKQLQLQDQEPADASAPLPIPVTSLPATTELSFAELTEAIDRANSQFTAPDAIVVRVLVDGTLLPLRNITALFPMSGNMNNIVLTLEV